ncbi:protein FAM91A1-like [Stegodyphus dumicola]|uniref:protein FAM91A1-like n=1 Tax=Stegodyphus dumicola TaxID=202533 RepID=UPI0015AF6AAE|nr:protein FAM91A1-like [Stegodyphus dumicola]
MLLTDHYAVKILAQEMDLKHNCGYITMMKSSTSAPFNKFHGNALQKLKGHSDIDLNSYSNFTALSARASESKVCYQSRFTHTGKGDGSFEAKSIPLQEEKEWVLLDCSFGIPLFDGQLNSQVCETLLYEQLCSKSSLKNLITSNRKLCLQVLEFISEYQPVILDSGRNISFPPNRPGCEQELPLPSENLIFCDGKLSIWNQK